MSGAVCSFFEGTEKKLEVIIDPALPSFRRLGDAFWAHVVRQAGADVLSKLTNHYSDAYLLSESSLFVFDHRAIMMTCGRTTLHDAALAMLDKIAPEQVRSLVYKRRHEVFPHDQPTSFFDDVRVLGERLPGRAFQFGNRDEHHLYLFHLDREPTAESGCTTVEMLMHGLSERVRDEFGRLRQPTAAELRERTGVHKILPGIEVGDHLFEPAGYSLNALRDDRYYAVHVTPEANCSYASFETNHRFTDDLGATITRLLRIFRPRAWDLILYDRTSPERSTVPGYRLRSHVEQGIGTGLDVRFLSYDRPQRSVTRAAELSVR